MKMKKYVICGLLLAVSGGYVFSSCSDDDDDLTCTCKRKDPYTGQIEGTMNAQPSSYGVSTCSQLAQTMAELSDGYYYYSCN